MTNKERDEITRSDEWIKIDYKFANSTGNIIIKKQLYDRRWKKIKRLFKDVIEIQLHEKYDLSLEELIDMDNEVNRLKNAILRYDKEIHNCPRERFDLITYRDSYVNRLNERIKEIKDEYNDRS